MSSRSSSLIVAWALVATAILAALTYAFLGPDKEPTPSTDSGSNMGEVRIALSDVPTIAETKPQSETPSPGASPALKASNNGPKIAIVVSGLGLSKKNTTAAIRALPAAISLSFTPYSEDLAHWLEEAREGGHEVMLDLPLEPASFPSNDPGPKALLTSLSKAENQARLEWILERGSDVVGMTGVMGSHFASSQDFMRPMLETLKERGLLYLDNHATELSVAEVVASEIGLPHAISNRTLDESHASKVIIDARLAQIERLALTDGYAVAIAHPYPRTLERLATWSETLGARGFILVPLSAVAKRQPP